MRGARTGRLAPSPCPPCSPFQRGRHRAALLRKRRSRNEVSHPPVDLYCPHSMPSLALPSDVSISMPMRLARA